MSNRLIVDSHVLLWFVFEPDNLTNSTQEALFLANEVLVSSGSLWELAIKHKTGKLKYSTGAILKGVDAAGFTRLPIRDEHLLRYQNIKLPHKDPFDALLIAQSQVENAPLVTADSTLIGCGYNTIDARQ